jgi:exonuclease SbcD
MTEHKTISQKPNGSYRILHTADWHLGKLLNEQSREEEHTRFLDWLLQAVADHQVDAILLAGDVFDSGNPPQSAVARYFDFVSSLFRQGDCALVVIAGNHDSAAQLEAPKQALHALNVHVVGSMAVEPEDRILYLPEREHSKVAIAMMPFLRDRDLRVGKAGETADEIRAQLVTGIRQRYDEAAEAFQVGKLGCPAIATGHLTVMGAATSDSERDIHIGGLGAVTSESFSTAFSYVALGHLHRPQATDVNGRVRYAGSPISLSFSECGDRKEVRILDVMPDRIDHQVLPIPVIRRLGQIRTTVAGLEKAMKEFDPAPGELRTWVEVVVEDATLHDDLNEQVQELAEELDFDVLKVLRGRSVVNSAMPAGETTDNETIDLLLDHPVRVFEHLLGKHEQLDEKQVAELKIAFAALLEADAQSETTTTP